MAVLTNCQTIKPVCTKLSPLHRQTWLLQYGVLKCSLGGCVVEGLVEKLTKQLPEKYLPLSAEYQCIFNRGGCIGPMHLPRSFWYEVPYSQREYKTHYRLPNVFPLCLALQQLLPTFPYWFIHGPIKWFTVLLDNYCMWFQLQSQSWWNVKATFYILLLLLSGWSSYCKMIHAKSFHLSILPSLHHLLWLLCGRRLASIWRCDDWFRVTCSLSSLFLSFNFNSIQFKVFMCLYVTCVYIAKASEIDNNLSVSLFMFLSGQSTVIW